MKSSDIKNKMEIFISHSSDDSDIAESLINLIIKAFKLENKSIRCTSIPGYKLPSGSATDEQLRQEIFASKVFIGIITAKSITSAYVLFELGARWGSNLPLLPLLCDPLGTALLKGPLKNINVLNATDASDIHQFLFDLSEHLDIKPESVNAYMSDIETLRQLSSNKKEEEKLHRKVDSNDKKFGDFENADEIIKEKSRKDWPEDYEMQMHCINTQREAVKELEKGKPEDIGKEEFLKIRERAKREWPDDFEMRLHTEKRQIESLRKLRST